MTDKIIDFRSKEAQETPKETPREYIFTFRNDAGPVTRTGILSFNPLFVALVDTDNKLTFAVPMEEIRSIERLDA